MSVSGINNQNTYTSATAQTAANTTNTENTAKTETKTDTAAVYEKNSTVGKSSTYDPSIASQVKQALAMRDKAMNELVSQTLALSKGSGVGNKSFFANMNSELQAKFAEIQNMTPEQAAKEIEDDGYFGVEKTSQRLIDFAKAYAGNDAAKMEKMASAIEKGFKEAERVWGGKLPDISQKTYDATQEKLDAWRKEIAAANGTDTE